MIFFDATKTGAAGHQSGLVRVSRRLREELGSEAVGAHWPDRLPPVRPDDWFVTTELFSEAERPGFSAFLARPPCRTAALFHDAIPLRFPAITWPQSVARHPEYMKLLARFDRVWAVSADAAADLRGFWRWQGVTRTPPVEVLPLGADYAGKPRVTRRNMPTGRPRLLCVGIFEPRKNQAFLLDVCAALWGEGLDFELHLVGRVNPHFGRPVVERARRLQRTHRGRLQLHVAADDATLAELYATARATLFPTIAEGCGLPLLESLWTGVPCVCSDLPVLRENADGGGCVPVAVNDAAAWRAALRRIISDHPHVEHLTAQATARALPTWRAAADCLRAALAAPLRAS